LKVIPRDQHCISRRNISKSALKVMARLREHDFEAYLVGGAVRDLLLGGQPKDFDIATDATPEEVHGLFRNSRIIGRRFRIVHVRFGREVIEVTTFRGHHDSDGDAAVPAEHSRRSQRGLLLRDNVYGSLDEDALRRDLTVNALYYCSQSFAVYDHAEGLEDLEARRVRIIGEPLERYREDPVRMLRVVRFAAKLDFRVESRTAAAIGQAAPLLDDIPPARLFDELLKLFLAGQALPTLELLIHYRLLEHLFPEPAQLMAKDAVANALVHQAMASTDRRIAEGKPVTPAFILAALLWPVVSRRARALQEHGEPVIPAVHSAGQQAVSEASARVAIPRRFSQPMREIWEFQQRLEHPRGKKAVDLVEERRFRAAYDFLLLREEAGEDLGGRGAWWTEFQTLDRSERASRMDAESGKAGKRGRKRAGR
jgi:poly(A) polymerase